MAEVIFNPDQRLTRKQRDKDNKKWYKHQLDTLDKVSFTKGSMFGLTEYGQGISEYKRMKVNYDLFNNIVNKSDFEHVCYPFGKEVGELPADFTNKDIISGKVKALIGMEMRRPFSWKVIATNEEATTRKEQEETSMIKDYVINSILGPIKTELEQQYMQQSKGRELTDEEKQQIEQQIQQELQARTPEEVKRYMEREHQDPAEMLSSQILEYIIQKQDVKMKFNKGWKHGLIAGREIFWVGSINGEPTLKVVNPLRFDYDKSPDLDYIEEGEWACYEMYMTPSEVIKHFGQELSPVEIDEIYADYSHASSLPDSSFTFRNDGTSAIMGTRVIHCEWKSLKPIKFLTTTDFETGEVYETLVDESYELNKEAGDIKIDTEWIPAKFEGYKIGSDKYAFLREVPGQNKDLNNLYDCKLSYIGAAYDNLNSEVTSIVDRMKYYQYIYNILFYRIELLIASDDGKSLLLNAGLIPNSSELSTEQWMYYFKVNKLGLLDPAQEGTKGNPDITQAAKEIDMSLVSDIKKYIELADYIERRCGESVGITKQVEGQIGSEEAVRNTQQALTQSANILEPYFELHNNIKRNTLQALIEQAKVAYAEFKPMYLSYMLDDMTKKMIDMDYDLLDNSSYGIFVSNSMKADQILQAIQQLSQAALQNQRVELSDVISIMNSESVKEAGETLKVAEKERAEQEQAMEQQKLKSQEEQNQAVRQWEKEKMEIDHRNKMEEIELKGKFDLQKQVMLSMGFNEDKDLDNDGVPDVLEIYKASTDTNLKQQKIDLDKEKLQEQKKEHKDKMQIEEKKIKKQSQKSSNSK